MGDYLNSCFYRRKENQQVLRNTWASHRHLPGLSALWQCLCHNVRNMKNYGKTRGRNSDPSNPSRKMGQRNCPTKRNKYKTVQTGLIERKNKNHITKEQYLERSVVTLAVEKTEYSLNAVQCHGSSIKIAWESVWQGGEASEESQKGRGCESQCLPRGKAH